MAPVDHEGIRDSNSKHIRFVCGTVPSALFSDLRLELMRDVSRGAVTWGFTKPTRRASRTPRVDRRKIYVACPKCTQCR